MFAARLDAPIYRLLAVALVAALAGCAHGPSAPGFTLIDSTGARWSLADQTEPLALTFGYTHCSDTCPLTLAKLARLADSGWARARDLTVAFVTVDPRRDSPRVLRRFLQRFHSDRLVGLTGSTAQIDAVESAYHIWAQSLPPRGPHGYGVAHSEAIVFVDRGRIAGYADAGDSLAQLQRAVETLFD